MVNKDEKDEGVVDDEYGEDPDLEAQKIEYFLKQTLKHRYSNDRAANIFEEDLQVTKTGHIELYCLVKLWKIVLHSKKILSDGMRRRTSNQRGKFE